MNFNLCCVALPANDGLALPDIGIKAAKAGHRVLFDSATGWVARPQEAHARGKLAHDLVKLRRYSLLVVDLCRARNYAEATGVAV